MPAHQPLAGIEVPSKANNIASFENLDIEDILLK